MFLTVWHRSLAPVQKLVLFHGADVPHCGAAEVQGRRWGTGVGAKRVFGWEESFAFSSQFGISFFWTAGLNTADGDIPGGTLRTSKRRRMKEVVNSSSGFLVFAHDDPFSLFLHLTPPPYPKG